MGMTFWFSGDEPRTTVYECMCTYEKGLPHPECTECKGDGLIRIVGEVHSMHLSNSNAARVLSAAGFPLGPDEYATSVPASWETLRQIHEATANRIDIDDEDGTYIRNRLFELRDIVAAAMAFNAPVVHVG